MAGLGLALAAIPACRLKKRYSRISGHPQIIVAQILTFQAIVYIFSNTAKIAHTCIQVRYSVIRPMAYWVPIKLKITYYHKDPEIADDTVTFRMIWMVSHQMLEFMGMFTIILCLFYVLDLIQTWHRPFESFAFQKFTTPLFLSGAKMGQVIYFALLGDSFFIFRSFNIVLCGMQLLISFVFFFHVLYRQVKKY